MTTSGSAASNAPKKLALVITELDPGGAERCLVELATRIDRTKFLPIVVSLAPPPVADKQLLVDRLKTATVPTHFLGFTRGWDYFAAVQCLSDVFKSEAIELVQAFLFHANVVAARAAAQTNIKHVFAGIRVADPRRWRTFIERCATWDVERFVCVSQSVAEACRYRGFASEKLVVIPNGVDLGRWQNRPPSSIDRLGLAGDRRALLFVGRLDAQKGLERFFRELPVIFQNLPQHHFVLVGEGPQKERLARIAERSGLTERVHFLGWQTDTTDFIAAADVLILPSRWEGMPNVVLEAMAAGKPVVATQAEGTVELMGLGALDQTAALGDWQGFRNRLMEIAKNPALAADLGQRNQARAAQFSIEAMVQRYERLYAAAAAS